MTIVEWLKIDPGNFILVTVKQTKADVYTLATFSVHYEETKK